MPFMRGKFKPHGQPKPKPTSETHQPVGKKMASGPPQQPHDKTPPKHVTQTHPGMTKPHPATGVHAVMTMHKGEHHGSMHGGGGEYKTETHHDDGSVEERDNQTMQDAQNTHAEAFPDDESDGMHDQDNESDEMGSQFAEDMGEGIGGNA